MDPELLKILVCPESRMRLTACGAELVAQLNDAVREKRLKNRAGRPIESPLGGGLVRDDEKILYPIVDGIPVLLADEGIPLAQVQSLGLRNLS